MGFMRRLIRGTRGLSGDAVGDVDGAAAFWLGAVDPLLLGLPSVQRRS